MVKQQQPVSRPFIQDDPGKQVPEKNIQSLTSCVCGYYTTI